MNRGSKRRRLGVLLLAGGGLALTATPGPTAPVTPDAIPEVGALLKLLHEISGRSILTGQHNYPNTHSRNSEFAASYIGKAAELARRA